MDLEDPPLGFLVWERELDLSIDSARADQRGVQRLDAVRRHDHLKRQRDGDGEEARKLSDESLKKDSSIYEPVQGYQRSLLESHV